MLIVTGKSGGKAEREASLLHASVLTGDLAGVRAGQLVNVQGLLRIIGMLWPMAALAWFAPQGRRPVRRWL